jgi:hypothetical protein
MYFGLTVPSFCFAFIITSFVKFIFGKLKFLL